MTTKTSELSYRVHQSERSGGLEGSEQAREAMAQASEKYPCLPAGTVAPIALAQELALKWDTTVRRLPRSENDRRLSTIEVGVIDYRLLVRAEPSARHRPRCLQFLRRFLHLHGHLHILRRQRLLQHLRQPQQAQEFEAGVAGERQYITQYHCM